MKPSIKTFPFKDEDGNVVPGSTFTIRTKMSHQAKNAYASTITSSMGDIREAMGPDGKIDPSYKPNVSMETIEAMQRVLLEHGLVGLEGMEDIAGKEIKVWHEFLSHEEHYVDQVIDELTKIANDAVKNLNPDPKGSAPSGAPSNEQAPSQLPTSTASN